MCSAEKRTILVVEDDAILALDLEMMLSDAGFQVLGPASSVREALDLIETEYPEFATLDYHLGRETSAAVARCLALRGTPFIYVSGGDDVEADRTAPRAPIVPKPATAQSILAALRASQPRPARALDELPA